MSARTSAGRFGFYVQHHQSVVATFNYVDTNGNVLYRKHRIEPGGGGRAKTFLFDQPDGKGGWKIGMGDKRVPYRLLDLDKAVEGEAIFMAEGEAKADKLANWGRLATSFKDWPRAGFAHLVRGRKVFILPDNDEPGRKQAKKAYDEIAQSGGAPVIVELPRLPHGGDIIDWEGSSGDFSQIITELEHVHKQKSHTDRTSVDSGAFKFVSASELKYTQPEFLIDGILETDTLSLGFGDPGSAKSFISMDVALSVATGTDFHGRKVKQGAVFYIAGEGHNGLGRRFQAWSRHRGVPLLNVPCFVSKRSAQFLDDASAKAVTDAIGQLAERHGAPSLIVIDTLARNFGPGDENSNTEMGKFIAAIDSMRSKFSNCAVLIIHHSGHAAKHRARGAIALQGALDCEYRVEKAGDLVTLVNTKMKDAPQPPALAFKLVDVDIGNGASSAVLVEADAPPRMEKLSSAQKLARDTYITAAIEGSSWRAGAVAGLHISEWRTRFYAKHTGENIDTKRQAFNRVRKELQHEKLISYAEDLYLWNDEAVIATIESARKAGLEGQGQQPAARYVLGNPA